MILGSDKAQSFQQRFLNQKPTMSKAGTKRAAFKASRNGTLKLNIPGTRKPVLFQPEDADFIRRFAKKETNGDLQAMLEKIVHESEAIRNNPEIPPVLKTVIKYEIPGVSSTADTLYWGGRWPDDFFLGRRCSGKPPEPTCIADVFNWLETIEEMGRYGFVNDEDEGELGLKCLYHAAALELRMDSTKDEINTEEQYREARQRERAAN